MNEPVRFRKLYQLFFVSLVGANQELQSLLRKFFRRTQDENFYDFFYYEYLLHKPFFYKKDYEGKNRDDVFKDFWFFAPFLLRLSKKANVYFDLNDLKTKLADPLSRLKYIHLGNLDHAIWMNKILDFWIKNYDEIQNYRADQAGQPFKKENEPIKEIIIQDPSNHPPLQPRKFSYRNQGMFYAVVPNYTVKFARDEYTKQPAEIELINDVPKKITEYSKWVEHCYRLGYLHDLPVVGAVLPTLVLPLITRNCFYGEIILCFPGLGNNQGNAITETRLQRIAEMLLTCAI